MPITIVTGASSGIGAALTRRAREKGWNVLAVARRAERLSALAQSTGCATFVADVTAKDAAAKIVAECLRLFGGIEIVINNAGAANPGGLLEQTDAEIERQWQLHVAGPLRLARAALPHVRQSRGGFVFFGSGLARVPAPNYGAYASAKAAARAAAIQLRRELRPQGIFVTYIDPGVVDTEFSQASGMTPHPAWWHGKPDGVAARIIRGLERRAARVNAIPWQTAATVAGEWFPFIADAAMAKLVTAPADAQHDAGIVTLSSSKSGYDEALEPLRRRMERVKLSDEFVRSLLVPGEALELNDAAMRWAGMPNKNERAALNEVLEALASAGFLEPIADGRWSVLRAP